MSFLKSKRFIPPKDDGTPGPAHYTITCNNGNDGIRSTQSPRFPSSRKSFDCNRVCSRRNKTPNSTPGMQSCTSSKRSSNLSLDSDYSSLCSRSNYTSAETQLLDLKDQLVYVRKEFEKLLKGYNNEDVKSRPEKELYKLDRKGTPRLSPRVNSSCGSCSDLDHRDISRKTKPRNSTVSVKLSKTDSSLSKCAKSKSFNKSRSNIKSIFVEHLIEEDAFADVDNFNQLNYSESDNSVYQTSSSYDDVHVCGLSEQNINTSSHFSPSKLFTPDRTVNSVSSKQVKNGEKIKNYKTVRKHGAMLNNITALIDELKRLEMAPQKLEQSLEEKTNAVNMQIEKLKKQVAALQDKVSEYKIVMKMFLVVLNMFQKEPHSQDYQI